MRKDDATLHAKRHVEVTSGQTATLTAIQCTGANLGAAVTRVVASLQPAVDGTYALAQEHAGALNRFNSDLVLRDEATKTELRAVSNQM